METIPPLQLDRASKLLQQHGVVYAGLFGSRAKGTAQPQSDFDIEQGRRYSLFDLIDISNDFRGVLAAKVDLVTTSALNRHIKQEVLRSVVPLYDRR